MPRDFLARMCADTINDMPDDYSPEIVDEGDKIVGRESIVVNGNRIDLSLGFTKSVGASGSEDNKKSLANLRYSFWQSKEMYRLGWVK